MELIPVERSVIPPHTLSTPDTNNGKPGFSQLLQGALDQVNRLQHEADAAARDFAVGDAQNIHEIMIAMEKADISLRLLTQIRNKAIESYQEIMRMQI